MRSFYKDKVGRSACSPLIVPALVTRRIRLLGYGRCDRVNGRSRPTASSQLDQTLHARNEKNYAALRRSSNFCMVDWHRSDWCNDSFGKRLRRRCTISIFTFGDRGKVATTSISDTSSCSQQWNLETRERVYTYAERKAEMSPSQTQVHKPGAWINRTRTCQLLKSNIYGVRSVVNHCSSGRLQA